MDRPADAPEKARGAQKTARIPIKIVPKAPLPKPEWIRVRLAGGEEAERFQSIKATLRAHRLHTVTGADNIVVLDAGHVVETGTHGDLMAAGGRYRALWDATEVPTTSADATMGAQQ